ncbi:MAG: radical SAM protein [Candidatus Margulisiibacteriota bacterium]
MKEIEYYFKATKQCNLRCLYCCEQENYKHRQVFNPKLMERFFKKILYYHQRNKLKTKIGFCYTGGEIMTLGKDWLRSVLTLQKEIFCGTKIKYTTTIQTNLTLLDKEWVNILKGDKVIVGSSLDLFAKTRPFLFNGEDSAKTVVDKLILLADNDIKFGVILVVTRHNVQKGKQIFKALNEAGLSFHALPLEPESVKYSPDLEIAPEEYVQFLIDIAEGYISPKRKIRIPTLDGYIDHIKRGGRANKGLCMNARICLRTPRLFFENTGEAYFCGCFCKPEVVVGNIFTDSIGQMFHRLSNKKVFKKLANRYKLIRKICDGCEYLSACNGGCPSFAYQEGNMFSKSRFFCRVNKKLFPYLKQKLKIR